MNENGVQIKFQVQNFSIPNKYGNMQPISSWVLVLKIGLCDPAHTPKARHHPLETYYNSLVDELPTLELTRLVPPW
jgi:hypothetical protein